MRRTRETQLLTEASGMSAYRNTSAGPKRAEECRIAAQDEEQDCRGDDTVPRTETGRTNVRGRPVSGTEGESVPPGGNVKM